MGGRKMAKTFLESRPQGERVRELDPKSGL